MGNAQASNRRGSKQTVTVLQGDGRVLEFSRPLRVAELLYDHPHHFVCHSSALVLLQHGKMLPANALLMRGEVYFLLPLPESKPSKVAAGADNNVLLASGQQREEAKVSGTMKVLITRQQLAKILAEGSIKMATRPPVPPSPLAESNADTITTSLRVLHRPSPTLTKRTVTWSPRLESISEVPVM